MRIAIVIFRNDLRIHDNPTLHHAIRSGCSHLLPIFIYDNQYYSSAAKTWNFKFPRLQRHKQVFLIEALMDLKSKLTKLGSDLAILKGDPVKVLKSIIPQECNAEIWMAKEFTFEEQRLERQLSSVFKVHLMDSASIILNPDDWVHKLPDVYTEFRIMVEKKKQSGQLVVNDWVMEPDLLPPLPFSWCNKDCDQLQLVLEGSSRDPRSAFPFKGGETDALLRLRNYIQNGGLRTYKSTRNGLLGSEYSTKFSPWLAIGNISPRRIIAELESCDESFDQGSYWVWFELLWRDYFKLISLKYKNLLFNENGLMPSNGRVWQNDPDDLKFKAWSQGKSGIPFIDANMRELLLTGFMSNRGRQNVASFLIKDLQIDWRKGAEWFESMLIDHDPSVNYGNWLYIAGLGNDPRSDRYFNVIKQAKDYDPDCKFILSWCPEILESISNSLYYHFPWKVPNNTYIKPIMIAKAWEKHTDRKDSNKSKGYKRERVKK